MGDTKMKISALVGVVLLAIGVVLLFFGFNAASSPIEEVGEALTGRYSNETMGYFIAGAAAGVAGLFVIIRRR